MNRLNLVVAMSTAVSAGLAGCPQDDSDSGVEGSLAVDEQTEDFARHGDEAVGALNLAGGLETLATGCTELLGRVAAPRTATDALSAEEPARAQTSFETAADDAVTAGGSVREAFPDGSAAVSEDKFAGVFGQATCHSGHFEDAAQELTTVAKAGKRRTLTAASQAAERGETALTRASEC